MRKQNRSEYANRAGSSSHGAMRVEYSLHRQKLCCIVEPRLFSMVRLPVPPNLFLFLRFLLYFSSKPSISQTTEASPRNVFSKNRRFMSLTHRYISKEHNVANLCTASPGPKVRIGHSHIKNALTSQPAPFRKFPHIFIFLLLLLLFPVRSEAESFRLDCSLSSRVQLRRSRFE